MNKFVVIIPIYNHKDTITDIVKSIINQDLPLIIVDDGSNNETKKTLNDIDKCYKRVDIITLPINSGKGVALSKGLLYADSLGYTHGITIDADGQHDIADIQKFIEASNRKRADLIAGNPTYDNSIPAERLHGRKISNFWTIVTTLSYDTKDVLCGFRCYPLSETGKLLKKRGVGKRMNFEPDILVRLYWEGVGITNVSTKICYPENSLSHFDYIKDNMRISLNFFILFWGMIIRFFKIRSYQSKRALNNANNWVEQKERGNKLGLYLTLFFYKLLGKKLARVILQPVILYFYLTDRKGRVASRVYLDQIEQLTNKKLSGYKHYLAFGHMMLDRFDVHRGESESINVIWHNQGLLEERANENNGLLVVGAHIGSFDILKNIGDAESPVKVRPLMLKKQAELINSFLESINQHEKIEVIEADEMGIDTILKIKDTFSKGEVVAMLADRHAANSKERVCKIRFLGKDATFPQGPWILAQLLKVPVIAVFPIATGYNKYEVFSVEIPILKGNRKDRNATICKIATSFISEVEKICIDYPYQWFNFFNVWDSNND